MSPVLVCNKWNKTNMHRRTNDLGERVGFFLSLMSNVLHQLLSNQDNISTVHNPKEKEIMKMTENDSYRWSRWRLNNQRSSNRLSPNQQKQTRWQTQLHDSPGSWGRGRLCQWLSSHWQNNKLVYVCVLVCVFLCVWFCVFLLLLLFLSPD